MVKKFRKKVKGVNNISSSISKNHDPQFNGELKNLVSKAPLFKRQSEGGFFDV
jgi:hypothetical protein